MKGGLPDQFTLAKGRWKVVYRDGAQAVLNSDGGMTVNMNEVLWVMQVFP